jgi:hypothetical protein
MNENKSKVKKRLVKVHLKSYQEFKFVSKALNVNSSLTPTTAPTTTTTKTLKKMKKMKKLTKLQPRNPKGEFHDQADAGWVVIRAIPRPPHALC